VNEQRVLAAALSGDASSAERTQPDLAAVPLEAAAHTARWTAGRVSVLASRPRWFSSRSFWWVPGTQDFWGRVSRATPA